MTTPRDRIIDDLLASCRDLRVDPDLARLRVIESLEELDRLDALPPARPVPVVLPSTPARRHRHYGPKYTWSPTSLMTADTHKMRKILLTSIGCVAGFVLFLFFVAAFMRCGTTH